MRYRGCTALLSFALLLSSAQAQSRGAAGSTLGGQRTGDIHVHVIYSDDRRASTNLQVQLMQGASTTPVATTYTNDAGVADFMNIQMGDYHVVVSGDGIQTTQSELFEIDPRRISQSEYVTVLKIENGAPKVTEAHSSSTVSASELNVPAKARKELAKANESMARQDWKKALEEINKAIAIYPQYAAAYNNLGVLYSRTNDDAHGQEALEKAISLDGHLTAAYVNLSKLYLREKDYPKAEALLEKAVSNDPNNCESLMLLADAQFLDRHYDAAIASARQAHIASHTHPAFVHYIAARAYDSQNRRQEAVAELELFLKEEPTGPRADQVRAALQKQPRQAR